MSLEIQGTIKKIGDIQQISPTFAKRELVMLIDGQYPQVVSFDFSQNRMEVLDKFKEGEYVKVSFDLRGREWLDPKTNVVRYFNTLAGWKIEPSTPGYASQPPVNNGQNPFNTQSPVSGNSAATTAFEQVQTSTKGDSSSDSDDDLPF